MLLAFILIAFSGLALGILTLLDRYETATDKSHADRRTRKPAKQIYYDAFSDRRQQFPDPLPAGRSERRQTTA